MTTLAEVLRLAGRRHVETMTAETTARISDAEAEAALDWFAARLADPAVVEAVARALHAKTMGTNRLHVHDESTANRDEWPCRQNATAALAAITTALSTEAS